MRRKVPFLLLAVAVWAGACSDDEEGGFPPPAEPYVIGHATGSITIPQDTTIPLGVTVVRGGTLIKYPSAVTINVDAVNGYPAETVHVEAGAQIIWSNQSGALHNIDFRNFPNNDDDESFPDISSWTNGDTLRIMPNPGREFLYIYRCTRSGHGSDSGFIMVHTSPLLTYRSDDYNVANVSGTGQVTGVTPGTTTIHVSGSGASLSIPVTVTAVPADFIELTYLDVLDPASRLREFTVYAYPGDEESTRLRAVIKAGEDTIFCNRCVDYHERRQRYVNFISRDTTKLTVTNAEEPTAPVDAGMMFARDTTVGDQGVWVVLETRDQQIRDSVEVHVRLRPIDSLEARLDSFPDPLDPGDWDPYPTTAIRVDSIVGLGVTFWARAYEPLDPNEEDTEDLEPRFIQVLETGEGRRPTLPIVTWESANEDYVSVTSTGHATGERWFTTTLSRLINCEERLTTTYDTVTTTPLEVDTIPPTLVDSINGGSKIPGTIFAGPRLRTPPFPLVETSRRDSLDARYTVPGCSPTQVIPMPGAFCTSYQGGGNNPNPIADPSSVCTVWIKATAIDPVTGEELFDMISVTVRRP